MANTSRTTWAYENATGEYDGENGQKLDAHVKNKSYENNELPFQKCTEFEVENENTNVNKNF